MSRVFALALAAYLLALNIAAIAAFGVDKRRAIRHERRIPERTLLIISALGGSIAMLLTMKKIRHKTSKTKFMIGIPVIIFLQAAVIIGTLLLINR